MDETTRRAFAQWTQAQPAVSAFLHAIVGNGAERDDCMQEVAMAVLESYDGYDPSRPFLPWVMGIAQRTAADSVRRRSRRPLLLQPEAADALAAAIVKVADLEHARMAHLADCIAKLEGQTREICELRYRRGLKPARIAEILGIQPNTAAKSLQRMREQLRACIEQRVAAEGGA
ncbi:MAG: sigma-70 family RNA polymerase sigma factor [Planctomycetota bacterium]